MGEAIQIADFDAKSKRPVLNLNAVKRIINSRGTQDLPTIIVSIGGVARSGKSFLLNLMVNYLQYVEKVGVILSGILKPCFICRLVHVCEVRASACGVKVSTALIHSKNLSAV